MKHRNEQRELKRAAYDRVDRYARLINEIKAFPFKMRLSIAWSVIKGNKKR